MSFTTLEVKSRRTLLNFNNKILHSNPLDVVCLEFEDKKAEEEDNYETCLQLGYDQKKGRKDRIEGSKRKWCVVCEGSMHVCVERQGSQLFS